MPCFSTSLRFDEHNVLGMNELSPSNINSVLTKGFDIEFKPEDNAGARMSYHRLGHGYTEDGNQKELPTCQCKDLEQPFSSRPGDDLWDWKSLSKRMQWGCLPQARRSVPVLSSYAIAGQFCNDFALKAAQAKLVPGAGLEVGLCGALGWCPGDTAECCRAVITQGVRMCILLPPACRELSMEIGGDSM